MKTLQSMFLAEVSEMIDIEARFQNVFTSLEKSSERGPLAGILGIQCFEAARRGARLEQLIENMGCVPRSRPSTVVDEIASLPDNIDQRPLQVDQLFRILLRIDHYLLAAYGCLRDWAALLGNELGAAHLHESWDEIRAFEASLVHLARAAGFDPPLEIARRERRAPLTRLLSRREMDVLHWLAQGVASKHAKPAPPATVPAGRARLRIPVSPGLAPVIPMSIPPSSSMERNQAGPMAAGN